ncbi:MAG: sigma-70 family RNA polymerase sigma factor [Saprospiraceae bacterium]|nr:sigma-70 family RNA polymerase sigma factor [Saprospiraceae bacterium]
MKTNQGWTEQSLVASILQGGNARQTAIRFIYEDKDLRQMVIRFVNKNRGNDEDGQDMFHEGIIVLDRNIREGKFRGEAPLKGYLYSICRFLWMNRMRKQSHTDTVAEMPVTAEVDTESPEVIFVSEERKAVLNRLLDEVGERCRKILELWKLSYSMEEIAEKLDFSSAAMARKAKYRCHISLMELVQKNPALAQTLQN